MSERVANADAGTVFILIGPKGSGKTFIGEVLERAFHLPFLRVEALLIAHIEKFGEPEGGLKRHGFDIEEEAIDATLRTNAAVIFEATGSSEYFPSVLDNLGAKYNVKLIRILCPLDTCIERIKQRASAGQFAVADDLVNQINRRSAAVSLAWDLVIDNSNPASEPELITRFKALCEVPGEQ